MIVSRLRLKKNFENNVRIQPLLKLQHSSGFPVPANPAGFSSFIQSIFFIDGVGRWFARFGPFYSRPRGWTI